MRMSSSWRLSAAGSRCHRRPLELTGARRSRTSDHSCRRVSETSRGTPPIATRCGRRTSSAATNGAGPRGRFNSEGRHQWWGILSRTLETVLEHIGGNNSSCLEYPACCSFSRRRGGSWMPRRMETASSSSSGSHSCSSGSPTLLPVKPEPLEKPLGRHTRNGALVINEGGASSPPASSSYLVKLKTKPAFLPVKQEHLAMAVDDETVLKCTQDDYVRKEMERQRCALEDIAARHRGREEGGGVILDDGDDDAPGPSNPVNHGEPGRGAARTAKVTTAATTPISTSFSACRRRRRATMA
ncbi:hypothetical protein ZWY2020_004229 [Hordeum vulgare]|nr:hypothetical protein ZWY2020_004229 [Hordeum vulgare]